MSFIDADGRQLLTQDRYRRKDFWVKLGATQFIYILHVRPLYNYNV